jgi:hypothetical protein
MSFNKSKAALTSSNYLAQILKTMKRTFNLCNLRKRNLTHKRASNLRSRKTRTKLLLFRKRSPRKRRRRSWAKEQLMSVL